MPMHGAFGRHVAELAGLKAQPPTVAKTIRTHQFAATRLSSEGTVRGITARIPNERSYIISLQLRDFEHRGLWLNGRPCPHRSLPRGTINLYDLELDVVADIQSPFDSIQFYLPRESLTQFSEQNDLGRVRNLDLEPGLGTPDTVVEHLARSLIPALDSPSAINHLFVEQVALSLYAHLVMTYGEDRRIGRILRGGLAPWQERRAKDLIDSDLGSQLSLAYMAASCGLSERHFARAFRQSVGMSPHQWLLSRRVDKGKSLLREEALSLADVALLCGFASQSHFTRVFTRFAGSSPGQWRRTRQ